MFEFLRAHQLNIMLSLSVACFTFALLLFVTRFLEPKRKRILIAMEFAATFLLFFDRLAYIYSGVAGKRGYVLVRLSNFFVFFLTAMIVLVFNMYLIVLINKSGRISVVPNRLKFVGIAALIEMFMVVLNLFTGMYYYFDDANVYHRGPGFLACYIIPILCPLIQYSVIRKYLRKSVGRLIYTSLVLYIFVPIAVGIIQIFAYGLSIVNMAMVLVSISLYVFTYLDINDTVERAHKIEMGQLQEESKNMKRMFGRMTTAFVTAVENKSIYSKGHSVRVASFARRLAELAGKNEDEIDKVYFAALLHDVGMVGMPDNTMDIDEDSEEGKEIFKQKQLVGNEILSSITEYPYLKESAYYRNEHFDGTGSPEGLKGNKIPEIARIIAVCDAFDTMSSKNGSRDGLPYQTVREEFIKRSGTEFDPEYVKYMINIMDSDRTAANWDYDTTIENELQCRHYRESITVGVPVVEAYTNISFDCIPTNYGADEFSAPAIVLFDSYDRRIHDKPNEIEEYRCFEYGEVWFDGRFVCTNARNIVARTEKKERSGGYGDMGYRIKAAKIGDHMKMELSYADTLVHVTVALPDTTKSVYIALTGENCQLNSIEASQSEDKISESDIERIVSEFNFTDRLESDIPNVQIDTFCSDTTESIKVSGELKLVFHAMSLPSANLIWHVPFVRLFTSEDGTVNGPGFKEYALIKLNGESTGDESVAENHLHMKKTDSFTDWEDWKVKNKEGYECTVQIVRKSDTITVTTENLGVLIENTTKIFDSSKDVYVTLTGDEVALTDIRIR